jgi:3-oxoacyl-[acyl-carrier-protein] synthase II
MAPGRRRVVITGAGALSAAGAGVEALWRSVLAPRSHLAPSARADFAPFAGRVFGELPRAGAAADTTAAARLASASVRAATEAVAAAGLERGDLLEAHAGIVYGTCLGAWEGTGSAGAGDPFPSPARRIAEHFGLRGGVSTVSTACSSGAGAIAEACARVRAGFADLMLAGGGDVLSPFVVSGFAALQALTASCVRPFDRRRDGLALGEGAAILVLEDFERARRRGAPVLAEILGCGLAADAHHMTSPAPLGEGLARAARAALGEARVEARDAGFINAHATGTLLNDRAEAAAIVALLGESAARVPVNAIKPVVGHTLGAAGALEAIVCAQAIRDRVIPPTLGCEEIDPECGGVRVSGPGPAALARATALSLSSGFGGHNVALLVGAP